MSHLVVAALAAFGLGNITEPVVNNNISLTFSEWMDTHGKTYTGSAELMYRHKIYDENVAKIQAHNAGNHTWTMAVNKFADMRADEFASRYIGGYTPRQTAHKDMKYKSSSFMMIDDTPPASINWATLGAVTPIKNQQQCGSCWSFSATGAMEGVWFISKGELVSLSEQQLVDCSTAEGNQGCNGGMMDYAFQYVIDNKGITTEAAYPYTATGPNTCTATGKPIAATFSSFKDVPTNSDEALVFALAYQPVSVAVEADQASFQFYSGGVMTAACGTALDHGVLAVGYDTDSWIVKNSWGADWGVNGYIQLARGAAYGPAGQCGILSAPSFPVV